MNYDEMDIVCNVCKVTRLIVKKPSKELDKSHAYFSCSQCFADIAEERRRYSPRITDFTQVDGFD